MSITSDRETVNDTWHRVMDLADRTDWTAPKLLREALKTERRERSSLAMAKGMILTGMAESAVRVDQLYVASPGWVTGVIVAAHWKRHRRSEWQKLLPHLKAARDAHHAAVMRRVKAVVRGEA